jgi:hypothetical protein
MTGVLKEAVTCDRLEYMLTMPYLGAFLVYPLLFLRDTLSAELVACHNISGIQEELYKLFLALPGNSSFMW